MMIHSFILLASLVHLAFAVPPPTRSHVHDNRAVEKRLPSTWYHRADHPVYSLFRRNQSTDGVDYPTVGSPTWSSAYPTESPDLDTLPQAWVDALNAAVAAGAIPTYAPSTMGSDGTPEYPAGLDPTSALVCSGSYQCHIPGDIWSAPGGVMGAGFDDGPLPPSSTLYEFTREHNIKVTHFMIGVNILNNPDIFLEAFETNEDDIAVHTYTHPYMTTLSNLNVLGELGYTMQLIHDSTGGRIPKYWRPPYGDSDTRVRAIANEVFGLNTIFWNEDTNDWTMTETDGLTPQQVNTELTGWLTGPKSPGLIVLEHELSNLSVQAYIDAFPTIIENNWTVTSVARLADDQAYWNVGADGSVTVAEIDAYGNFSGSAAPSPSSNSTPTSSSPSSPSSSGSGSGSSTQPASSTLANNNGAAALGVVLPWWVATSVGMFSAVAALAL